MKKIFVIIALVAFVCNINSVAFSVNSTVKSSKANFGVVDSKIIKDKCPKCGKENCNGNCQNTTKAKASTTKDGKTCTNGTTGSTGCTKGCTKTKSCCSDKAKDDSKTKETGTK